MKTKKAMKKITHIGMAALVAMGMLGTSCNKVESPEIETPETQKENIVTLTTTVGFAADETKALTIDYTNKKLTKTFAVGEQVVLTYKDQNGNNQNTVSQALTPEDISANGKSAKLTFTLTNPKENGYISYQYPASGSSFYAQNGTLTDVATRDYATYDDYFAGTNLPTSATLENEIAVVAFTLYKSDGTTDITNTITGMTIEVSGVTYTITPSGLDKIYVAMWPEIGSEITITATDGSNNYTKTLTGKTYEAGEFYQQGLKMAKEVIWNSSKVAGISINEDPEENSFESDGITVAAFGDSGANFTGSKMSVGGWDGYFTFTSSVGNIKKIEINYTGDVYGYEEEPPVGWSLGVGTFTWEGDPATSVTLSSSGYASIEGITSIVFTLE